MKNKLQACGVMGAVLLLASGPASAQVAPTPQKSPRTPVSKETLAGKNAPVIPASRVLEGQAVVLDSERLRIGDIEVRLFGVVPPQMGASYGPQARAVIDSLTQGPVACQIKDREKSGSYLASCSNAANADFGLELLRRGLAAAARGSLRTSEYQTPYLAAESAAQTQHLGIWSTSMPSAASEKSIREAALKAEAEKEQQAKTEAEKAQKDEQAKAETAKAEAAAKAAAEQAKTATPLKVDPISAGAKPPLPQLKPDTNIVVSLGPTADDIQPLLIRQPGAESAAAQPQPTSFFERYQLLLSSFAALATSLVISASVFLFKAQQRKDDLRSTAAALRGELMAARAVCQARLSKIAQEKTEAQTSWPRIRILVFQAYVGRLGCLGAELSRQIASIYGMASDYASYYNTTDARSENTSKKQALEALIQYIEEVLPRLGHIEQDGKIPTAPKHVSFTSVLTGPINRTLSLSSRQPRDTTPPAGPGRPQSKAPVLQTAETDDAAYAMSAEISKAKEEIVSEDSRTRQARPQRIQQAPLAAQPSAVRQQPATPNKSRPKQTLTASARQAAAASTLRHSQQQQNKEQTASPSRFLRETAAKQQQNIAKTVEKIHDAAQTAIHSVAGINLKAPLLEKLSQIKSFASTQMEPSPAATLDPVLSDYTIPDYANLTEEELEALLYAEDEVFMNAPCGPIKSRRAG